MGYQPQICPSPWKFWVQVIAKRQNSSLCSQLFIDIAVNLIEIHVTIKTLATLGSLADRVYLTQSVLEER